MGQSTSRKAHAPERPDGDADLRVQLRQLIAANERLQEEIERRLEAEHAWAAERDLLYAMINQVPDYLFVKDTESRFVIANKAISALHGYPNPDDIVGKTDFDVAPPDIARGFYEIEQSIIKSGKPMFEMEELNLDPSGRQTWLSTTKVPLRSAGGEIIGLVGIARDVTERRQVEERIQFMAHHDALTGLPNRVLLKDRLSQALLQARRNGGGVAIAFLDLDKFKLINDSLGHSAGDELLITVAERMVGCVRATDTIVRIGGDEFIILLADQPENAGGISTAIEKIRAAIAMPTHIEEQLLHVTCSMGVATFPNDGETAEELLMNADAAMYRAKELGRDNFQFYTAEMNTKVHEKLSIQEEMRWALTRREFVLQYQPQLDLKTGKIFAVEALLRWNRPEHGMVPPAKFIPVAEESGLIVPLGDWVLHEACRQNKAWQDAGMPPINVSVNVSARQFSERNWVGRVANALEESGLEGKYLELELTESLLMHDVDHAIATMQALQELGVQLSIDDFGTGYSSLCALKSFPVARLKIDQSFVKHLPEDEDDRAITKAVISLGQKLNLKVMAEGVETEEQVAFLSANNCDEIQGFHFSRPVDAEVVAAMLASQAET